MILKYHLRKFSFADQSFLLDHKDFTKIICHDYETLEMTIPFFIKLVKNLKRMD